MKKDIKIGVAGGDARQMIMAEELASAGCECAVFGFENYGGKREFSTRCLSPDSAVRGADAVILPLPYSIDGTHLNCPFSDEEIKLTDLFALFSPGQLVAGGRFDKTAKRLAFSAGVRLYDYYDDESFSVLNTIPTAEGAAAIAINELPFTLHQSRAAVLGFGRVGKTLAKTLDSLGARISVAARRDDDLAWIKVMGYEAVKFSELSECIGKFDVIFNTVPQTVLTRKLLQSLKNDCVIIELASKPGGVDNEAAKELGVKVIWGLSLPGKTAPETAGKILAECIRNILDREEDK